MSQRSFKYPSFRRLPKGHIRLLTLLPGAEKSTIQCQLHTAVLSENPVFEALSYVWGASFSLRPDPSILLNGKSFVVKPNLGWALEHLRDVSKERVLWIDAICINQRNEKEKAIQVKQMGRVYSQAASLLIWIGKADKESRLALGYLHRLAETGMNDETITSDMEDLQYYPPGLADALSHTVNGPKHWYWYRLWIIQEVLLSSDKITLCFGYDRLSWNTLGLAISRLRHYFDNVARNPELKGMVNDAALRIVVKGRAATLLDLRLARNPSLSVDGPSALMGNTLRYILGLAQRAGCQELRDKVYGILGVIDCDMQVDYKKDMFEIYTEALHYFKKALTAKPSDQAEIYTARLSQIFQHLLKGPLPLQNRGSTISCIRLSGILSSQIYHLAILPEDQIEEPDEPDDRYKKRYMDSTEKRQFIYERVRENLTLYESSTGYKVEYTDKQLWSLAFELMLTPICHLVLHCVPHYFQATRTSKVRVVEIQIPSRVPQHSSVPTRRDINLSLKGEPHLFIASSMQKSVPSENIAKNILVGFATRDAQVGDKVVRFLGTDTCLVVRNVREGEYQFVGCAVIPPLGDRFWDQKVDEEARNIDYCSFRGSAPNYEQFHSAFHEAGEGVEIVIDVETLQFVTSIGLEHFQGEDGM